MQLAEIFTDHMVLQRDRKICIFGCGKGSGEIEFCGKSYTFISKNDKFYTYLDSQSAGGPYQMKVTLNGDTRVISDILIGDVYIAAGQSNMELPLGQTREIENFSNNNIRFFNEPNTADEDGNLVHNKSEWFSCCGDVVNYFSAIGYYFAAHLQKSAGVPIGVISCSKGASRVDAWTSADYTLEPDYQKMIAIRHNDYYVYKFNHNSWLYDNKLLNIVPFENSGILWYQGESNRCYSEGVHYAKLLEIMIKNWRELWQRNLPFYIVQLMPYDEDANVADWAVIRFQQELVTKTVDNTYLVSLVNTGEENEIHPTNKKTVSFALANAVRNIQFGDDVEYCGPVLEKYELLNNGIVLTFSHAEGLHIKGEELVDFYVYDKNGESLPVNYTIEKNCIKVFWQGNAVVERIGLGYCNAPKHNLYNSSDFLASPFNLEIKI